MGGRILFSDKSDRIAGFQLLHAGSGDAFGRFIGPEVDMNRFGGRKAVPFRVGIPVLGFLRIVKRTGLEERLDISSYGYVHQGNLGTVVQLVPGPHPGRSGIRAGDPAADLKRRFFPVIGFGNGHLFLRLINNPKFLIRAGPKNAEILFDPVIGAVQRPAGYCSEDIRIVFERADGESVGAPSGTVIRISGVLEPFQVVRKHLRKGGKRGGRRNNQGAVPFSGTPYDGKIGPGHFLNVIPEFLRGKPFGVIRGGRDDNCGNEGSVGKPDGLLNIQILRERFCSFKRIRLGRIDRFRRGFAARIGGLIRR